MAKRDMASAFPKMAKTGYATASNTRGPKRRKPLGERVKSAVKTWEVGHMKKVYSAVDRMVAGGTSRGAAAGKELTNLDRKGDAIMRGAVNLGMNLGLRSDRGRNQLMAKAKIRRK